MQKNMVTIKQSELLCMGLKKAGMQSEFTCVQNADHICHHVSQDMPINPTKDEINRIVIQWLQKWHGNSDND